MGKIKMRTSSPIFKTNIVFLTIILFFQTINSAHVKAECSKWANKQSNCQFTVGLNKVGSMDIAKGKINYMVIIDYFTLPSLSQQHVQPNPTMSIIDLSQLASQGAYKSYGNCKFCDSGKCLYTKEEYGATQTIITDELYDTSNQLIFAVCNAQILTSNPTNGSYGNANNLIVNYQSMDLGAYGVISIPYVVLVEQAQGVQPQFQRRYYGLRANAGNAGKFPFFSLICRNEGVLAMNRFTKIGPNSRVYMNEDKNHEYPIIPNVLGRFGGMQCDDSYAGFYFPYNPNKENYSYDGTRRII